MIRRDDGKSGLKGETMCKSNHYADTYTVLYVNYISVKKKGERGFPGGTVVKNPPANAGTWVPALVWEDPTCHGATKPVRHNY